MNTAMTSFGRTTLDGPDLSGVERASVDVAVVRHHQRLGVAVDMDDNGSFGPTWTAGVNYQATPRRLVPGGRSPSLSPWVRRISPVPGTAISAARTWGSPPRGNYRDYGYGNDWYPKQPAGPGAGHRDLGVAFGAGAGGAGVPGSGHRLFQVEGADRVELRRYGYRDPWLSVWV